MFFKTAKSTKFENEILCHTSKKLVKVELFWYARGRKQRGIEKTPIAELSTSLKTAVAKY